MKVAPLRVKIKNIRLKWASSKKSYLASFENL